MESKSLTGRHQMEHIGSLIAHGFRSLFTRIAGKEMMAKVTSAPFGIESFSKSAMERLLP